MNSFITKLQRKDYHTRRMILIIGTTVASLLVIGIWIFIVREARTDMLATQNPTAPTQKKIDAKPWSAVGAEITNTWGDIKKGFTGFSQQFQNAASSTSSSTQTQ